MAFHSWEAENFMVLAWLVNSMEPNINQTHLFLSIAKEMWDVIVETYSNM